MFSRRGFRFHGLSHILSLGSLACETAPMLEGDIDRLDDFLLLSWPFGGVPGVALFPRDFDHVHGPRSVYLWSGVCKLQD